MLLNFLHIIWMPMSRIALIVLLPSLWGMPLVMLTKIVMSIRRMGRIHLRRGRWIIMMRPWVGWWRLMSVHGRWCSVHVQVGRMHRRRRIGVLMIHVVWLFHFLLLFFLFSTRDWMHSIVFIGFSFVIHFFVIGQLLPGRAHQTSHTPTFRRNTTLRLFQMKDMRTEKHVVSRFVSFSIRLLVRGLISCHFLFVAATIRLGSV